MSVDYNEISKTYDFVREENSSIIRVFLDELSFDQSMNVLDFGCGTGNYAHALAKLSHAKVYGVEPSDGMREKAIAKNPNVIFSKGTHEHVPFEDNFFDFVYMTDVIHHIPDIGVMFAEISRVLKTDGNLCIVTESHAQIDNRFYVKYFPSTAIVDKGRYPDISDIISTAKKQPLKHVKNIITGNSIEVSINSDFIELVKNKGFSMFHLIPDDEYIEGLKQLEADIADGSINTRTSGDTLVWFRKKPGSFVF